MDLNFFITFTIIVFIVLAPSAFRRKLSIGTIGSIQVSLGIFGTFLGVFVGLQGFDVTNIQASVPELLAGLKMAFITSVFGLGASLLLKAFPRTMGFEIQELKEEQEQDALVRQMVSSLKSIEHSLAGEGEGSLLHQLALSNQEAMRASIQELFENFQVNTQAVLGETIQQFNEGVAQMMAYQEVYATRQEALLAAQEQVHQSMLDAEQAFTAFHHRAEQVAKIIERLDGVVTHLDEVTENFNESLGAIRTTIHDFGVAMVQVQTHLENLPTKVQNSIIESLGTLETTFNNLNETIEGIDGSIEAFEKSLGTFEKGLERSLNQSLAALGNALVSLSQKFVADYKPLTERLQAILTIAEGINVNNKPEPQNVQVQ